MTTLMLQPGLAAAVDGIVHRALERAGRRLWSHQSRSVRPRRLGECEAASYHVNTGVTEDVLDRWRLLEGAFDRVPEIAARYGIDPACLAATLEDYCRGLLTSGVAHEWRLVASLLHTPCLMEAVA